MFEKLTIKSMFLVGALASVACGGVCGDGTVDEENKDGVAEKCDDGNTAVGDGCDGICSAVESGFVCDPTAPGTGPSVCVSVCGNGVLDAGEECDGANFGTASCAQFTGTGTLACAADCTIPNIQPGCIATAGDGIRTSETLLPGQGEQCDDGNTTAGDGCAADMTLEALSTIALVDAAGDAAEVNNTTPNAATFSVFAPMIGVFDTGAQSLLFVVSTDNPDICEAIFLANGFNGFLDNLFGAGADPVPGTTVLTMVSQAATVGNFTAQTFTGTTEVLADATAVGTSAGYTVVQADGTIDSDTTFGTDGLGVINLVSINTTDIDTGLLDANGDPVLRAAGNLELNYTNINQITQFIPAETVIAAGINGNIKAVACSLDVF